MMKSHRLLPYLYATSWLGTLLLTLLACLLVFRQTDPLTPGIFAAAALCLLSGNLLPLAVYFLQLRREKAVMEAEAAEAELSVRHALARSEDVLNRLDEAEGSLSKALLSARQLPKRIEESSAGWRQVQDRLRELEGESLLRAMAEQAETAKALQADVEKCREEFHAFSENRANSARDESESGEESDLNERIDLLFETIESVQESVDAVAARLASLEKKPASKDKKPPAKPRTDKAETSGSGPQKELFKEPVEAEPGAVTEVFIHAMVGISNRLFLRGDGPHLSWEKGEPMQPVGIGEYRRTFPDLEEPIQLALLLNDEVWSAEGRFTVEPGKKTELHASFPKE